MTEDTKPRTPEDWAEEVFYLSDIYAKPIRVEIVDVIRRAQVQARREAIEECAQHIETQARLIRDANTVGFSSEGKHILRVPEAQEQVIQGFQWAKVIRKLLKEPEPETQTPKKET